MRVTFALRSENIECEIFSAVPDDIELILISRVVFTLNEAAGWEAYVFI